MGTHQPTHPPPDWRLRTLPSPDLHRQVAGRWRTLGLASSQARLASPDDPLRLALHSIETRDEDLEFVLFWT